MPKIMKLIRTGIARPNSSHICILRSARKDQLWFTKLFCFKFLWKMIDSMLSCSDRSGNSYSERALDGSRRVINISPGALHGSAGAPKGRWATPMDTVRYPVYLFMKIDKIYSRGAWADPLYEPRVLKGFFTGCQIDENAGRIGC